MVYVAGPLRACVCVCVCVCVYLLTTVVSSLRMADTDIDDEVLGFYTTWLSLRSNKCASLLDESCGCVCVYVCVSMCSERDCM